MPYSFRNRSSRPGSERSSSSTSSTSSQHLPQIRGIMTSPNGICAHTSLVSQPQSKKTSRNTNIQAMPMRQSGKSASTCLMQPCTVLSQSWCTNVMESEETVPQWVLDGARMADESPRSSMDSLEASGIQLCLEEAPAPPATRSIPIVCTAIIASWRQANYPPRWTYEASPKPN